MRRLLRRSALLPVDSPSSQGHFQGKGIPTQEGCHSGQGEWPYPCKEGRSWQHRLPGPTFGGQSTCSSIKSIRVVSLLSLTCNAALFVEESSWRRRPPPQSRRQKKQSFFFESQTPQCSTVTWFWSREWDNTTLFH